MRNNFTSTLWLTAFMLMAASQLQAQTWCVPNTATPYSQDMPGITNFKLGTIDRTSAAIENYPNNSYVNTGASTTLQAGQTYTVSITHTKDAVIFPNVRNNIRVWIDYNKNGSFLDAGETAVSKDYATVGTSTFTFTVPSGVGAVADTRLRITAKMSDEGGHSIPTPCDIPADPIGYHGEIEDYNVSITAATGITPATAALNTLNLWPNPVAGQATLQYTVSGSANVEIGIYNMDGTRVAELLNDEKSAGIYELTFNPKDFALAKGIYLLRMSGTLNIATIKMSVLN